MTGSGVGSGWRLFFFSSWASHVPHHRGLLAYGAHCIDRETCARQHITSQLDQHHTPRRSWREITAAARSPASSATRPVQHASAAIRVLSARAYNLSASSWHLATETTLAGARAGGLAGGLTNRRLDGAESGSLTRRGLSGLLHTAASHHATPCATTRPRMHIPPTVLPIYPPVPRPPETGWAQPGPAGSRYAFRGTGSVALTG